MHHQLMLISDGLEIQRPQVRVMIIGFGKTKCFGNTKGLVEMKLDRPNSQENSTKRG
jgi:hypothetical protein